MDSFEELKNALHTTKDSKKSWRIRREAINPIIKLETSEAYETLFQRLKSETNSSVRLSIVRSLGVLKKIEFFTPFFEHYKKEWDSGIRLKIVEVINAIEGLENKILINFLTEAEKDNRERIRDYATSAIRERAILANQTVMEFRQQYAN